MDWIYRLWEQGYWQLLVAVAIAVMIAVPALFGVVSTFFACLFETQQVHRFRQPARASEVPPSSYAEKVNADAAAHGWQAEGPYVYCRGIYRCQATFYYSDDRRILAVVGGGTILGMSLKNTSFYARFGDFVGMTSDETGEYDLSGFMRLKLLPNAAWSELEQAHRAAVERRLDKVQPFSEESAMAAYEALHEERADRMVRRRLARHCGGPEKRWRYTLLGAVLQCTWGFGKQLHQALQKQDEFDRPRPGD